MRPGENRIGESAGGEEEICLIAAENHVYRSNRDTTLKPPTTAAVGTPKPPAPNPGWSTSTDIKLHSPPSYPA